MSAASQAPCEEGLRETRLSEVVVISIEAFSTAPWSMIVQNLIQISKATSENSSDVKSMISHKKIKNDNFLTDEEQN